MRKQTWMRFGLASVIMTGGAAAVLAVGCGGDDVGPNNPTDGGSDHTNGFDTGLDVNNNPDSPGTDSGDSGGPKHAKLIGVHASPNAPDLRFCFGVGVKADGSDGAVGPVPALPHDDSRVGAGRTYPALYAGFGGPFADIADLEPKALTGFVIPMTASTQTKLKNDVKSSMGVDGGPLERSCDTLIGATGTGGVLVAGEFFKLPTIPAGTFVKGNTFLLAITGCVGGDTSGTGDGKAKCGADYVTANPLGNIRLSIVKLDKAVADAAKLGLQVLHLSSAADGLIPLGSGGAFDLGVKTYIGLTRNDLDGGNPPNPPAANGVNYGYGTDGGTATPEIYSSADFAAAVAYAKIVGLHTVPANPDAGTDASVAAIPAATVPIPFGFLQALSGYGLPPDGGAPIYLSGANYTVIFLGDPSAAHQLVMTVDGGVVPDPLYDGHGLHLMMFPNDPVLPPL